MILTVFQRIYKYMYINNNNVLNYKFELIIFNFQDHISKIRHTLKTGI